MKKEDKRATIYAYKSLADDLDKLNNDGDNDLTTGTLISWFFLSLKALYWFKIL